MRTRERDSSVLLDKSSSTVYGTGFRIDLSNRQVETVSESFTTQRELWDRQYGFFIDEPHRPRSKRFGEASRWEERFWPNTNPATVHHGGYNWNGYDMSHIEYTDYGKHYIKEPTCGMFSHSAQQDLLVPWPYRLRSRWDLNNAVQSQRQRMFAYNGDLSETIGELPECPSLFRLINTAKSLRQNISGLALGIKFGWAPLYSTFRSALAELDAWRDGVDAMRRRSGLQTVRYSTPDSWSLAKINKKVVLTELDLTQYEEYRIPQLIFHEGKITYSAVVDMRPYYDGRLWDLMSRLSRVGGIPSLRTFWELTPKSFLIDWFVSIGDVISDIQGNLLYHMDVKEQCWSWKIHDRMSQYYVSRMDNNLLTEVEYKAFYRSSTPPLGSWKVPRIGLPSSLGQYASLALIVSQVIPSKGVPLKVLMRRINRFGYR